MLEEKRKKKTSVKQRYHSFPNVFFVIYLAWCWLSDIQRVLPVFSAIIFSSNQRKIFGNSVRCYPSSLRPTGFCIFWRLIMGDDQLHLNLLPSIRFFLYLFIIQALQFQSLGQTSSPTVWGISTDPIHSAKLGRPAGTSYNLERRQKRKQTAARQPHSVGQRRRGREQGLFSIQH